MSVIAAKAWQSQRIRALGAAEVIGPEALEAESALADIVIDTVGEALQKRALAALRPGAILVSAVSMPDAAMAAARRARAVFFIVEVTTERLARIADMAPSAASCSRTSASCFRWPRSNGRTRCSMACANGQRARSS